MYNQKQIIIIPILFLLMFKIFNCVNVPIEGGKDESLFSDKFNVLRFLLSARRPSGSWNNGQQFQTHILYKININNLIRETSDYYDQLK